MANIEIESEEEFLKRFPNYKEVQSLIEFFREVAPKPWKLRKDEDDICLVAKIGVNLELRLRKLNKGAELTFGDGYFWPDASIYAGLIEGTQGGQRHEVYLSLGVIYLSSKYQEQILELMKRFYEKFKNENITLDTERVIDGLSTEHPPY